jgi:signal transduction histidine kinase
LVSNALKFTERGEVTVGAEASAHGVVTFTVADTGIGIDPRHLDNVFEDFTQIDSVVQRRVTGTGLGLPLTRKLARLLGGDVTVVSELNVGSTFTATLPLAYQPNRRETTAETTVDEPGVVGRGGRHG